MINFLKNNLILPLCLLMFLGGPINIFAFNNSVSFEVPNVTIAPKSDFTVSVFVNTNDPINAFDVEISYPKDKLQLLSFDNAHSIADIWQSEPAVLSNGDVHLIGGIIKSFKGEKGLLMKINFRAFEEGDDVFSFVKNNLYIADGKATLAQMLSVSSTILIKKDGIFLSLVTSIPDTTLPSITLTQIEDPLSHAPLISFTASDSDYGIKQTQMRYKTLFSYFPWENVENPVIYPSDAWLVEFRTYSNGGALNTQTIINKNEIVKKILIMIVILLMIFFIFYRGYNRKKV